ncbi:MAG: cytochrome c biogenesis protein ResB [Planctomycetes bacterium]|nr:cytochrome c biogenesis protein ResB [Planctomycetota bacterium]
MKGILKGILDFFSSLGLSSALLILLALLTYLGTIDQVDHGLFEAQKKYFESMVVWQQVGPLVVPLPGAYLVMVLLCVNLVLGGLVRIRKGWATVGVIVTHCGIILMMIAGLVKFKYCKEGHVTLYEGQAKSEFESYYDWELVVLEPTERGTVIEHPIEPTAVEHSKGDKGRTFDDPTLPFALQVTHYMRNCQMMPKGPMFSVDVPVVDGAFLREMPLEKETEQNVPGVYVTAIGRDGSRTDGIVWGGSNAPLRANLAGKAFGLDLRRQKFPMPFEVRLDKFTKEDHPRMAMAKVFSSDVTVRESNSTRAVKISMNEPLRDKGLVLYQASWGPSNARPGERLFSTLAVVSNPSDQWPLWSCLVIAVGLLTHFTRKLVRHVRLEGKKS